MSDLTLSSLDIAGLSVDIPGTAGTLRAVRNVSLHVGRGETLGIVGESGSGKSMTALSIMNLLPPAAQRHARSISLASQDLAAANEQELCDTVRGQRIGMIFQEPMTTLNPVYSIGRQLTEVSTLHGRLSQAAAEARAVYLLEKVGLPDPRSRLRQYPHQLSGGQRQRVVIAMALMNEPELLIADEPTTALDVSVQAQILHLLKQLQQEFGMAMILITHDLGVVSRAADRIAVMYAGEVVETGTVAEVLNTPKHPYTQGLLACVPGHGGETGTRLGSIPGIVPSMVGEPRGCAFASRCPRVVDECRSSTPPTRNPGPGHRFVCLDPQPRQAQAAPEPTQPQPATGGPTMPARPARAETEAVLRVQDVNCTFWVRRGLFGGKRPLHALNGIDLEIRRGEVLALVGESGCGKTTLTRVMLGFQQPDSGSVLLDGKPIADLRGDERARRIQPIFQDPFSSLNPRKTIGEIIMQPLRINRLGDNRSRLNKTHEMMELVGLPLRVFNSYPSQLSGGQRQRVAIGRALIMRPEIVICDEPTSALDVSVQAQILNLLLDLRDELDLTYLFVTHNLSVVKHMADRVAVMYLGQIVERGERSAIFEHPRHPYTRALLASALSISPGESIPDTGLGGDFPNPLNMPTGCPFNPRCSLADGRCRSEVPPPRTISGTLVRCFHAEESPS